MKKKEHFFIGIMVAVLLAISAYLYWNADKAIEVSPPKDGIIKTENAKITPKPFLIPAGRLLHAI